jgi:hypothetical protein
MLCSTRCSGLASRWTPWRSFGAERASDRQVRRTSSRSATSAARTGSDSSRRTVGWYEETVTFGSDWSWPNGDEAHLAVLGDHLGLPVRGTAASKVAIMSGNAARVHDLRCAGITERKSSNPELVLALERCPPALRRHFVRGLFDGDGSAFEASNGRRILELSGHATMLSRVRSLVTDELAVAWNRLVLPLAGTEFATLRWRHPLDVAKLSLLLYDGARSGSTASDASSSDRSSVTQHRSTAESSGAAAGGAPGSASVAGAGG